jgi:hypothetical protein
VDKVLLFHSTTNFYCERKHTEEASANKLCDGGGTFRVEKALKNCFVMFKWEFAYITNHAHRCEAKELNIILSYMQKW